MRLNLDKLIDVRLFFFNGSKLVFCSRNAKSFYDEWKKRLGESWFIKAKSGRVFRFDEQDIVLLNLVPVSVSVNQAINRFSTASIIFSANKGRFRKRSVNNFKLYWDTWKDNLFDDDKDYEIVREFFVENLKVLEENDYYKNLYYYFDEKIGNKKDSVSRPFLVLDYGNLVFIEVLDRDGEWRNIFTGYVISVSENYVSAQDYRLTLNCVSLGNFFNIIPIFPDLGSGILNNLVLPSGDERLFWIGYYAQYRKTGDFWQSTYMGKSLLELLRFLIFEMRLRLGIVDEDELRQNLRDLRQAGIKPLSEELSNDETIKAIIEIYKKYLSDSPFVFPVFDENVRVYLGKSNKRGEKEFYLNQNGLAKVYIPPEFDLRKGGEGLSVLEYIYKDRIKDKLNIIQPDEVFDLFQRLIGMSITQGSFHPNEKKISEIFNAIMKVFGVIYFEDGLGNIIIDFPRYNEIPTSEYAFYDDLRGVEGKRYIIREHEGIINYNYTKSGEKFLTAFFFHPKLNIPNFTPNEILVESLAAGHAFHTPYHVLRFGYNVETVQDVYFNFELSAERLKELKEVFNEYARAMLEMRNAFIVKKMRITLRHRPDLLLGRTVYIPSFEKLFYITGISHSITLGSDYTTILELSAGHDIDLKLKEPRLVLMKKLKAFKDNVTATDGLTEGVYVSSCNIVRVNRKYFPANIKAGIMTVMPYPSQKIDEFIERRSVVNLPPFIDVLKDVNTEYIDIDIRLLKFLDWFFVYFTNFFNGRNVLDFKTLGFLESPDVLVFPYISDIWREKTKDAKYESRHFYGRAIDIAGVTFVVLTFKGLLEVLKKLIMIGGVREVEVKGLKVINTGAKRRELEESLKKKFYTTNLEFRKVEVASYIDKIWRYKIEGILDNMKKVVHFDLQSFKEWLDRFADADIEWTDLGSAETFFNLWDLIKKYIGVENLKWINKYSTNIRIPIDEMSSVLGNGGLMTINDEVELEKLREKYLGPFMKTALENEDNLILRNKLFSSDVALEVFWKQFEKVVQPDVLKTIELDSKKLLFSLAPENLILVINFHFNGIPDNKEIIAFKNRVSDWFASSILLSNDYFEKEGIGEFEDATGGLRKELQKNRFLYVNMPDEIKKPVESLAGDEEGTNGVEKRYDENYLIWKGGKRQNYDEIKNNRSWEKEDLDYYHLFHFHVSVGYPDCKKIDILKNVYLQSLK